MYLELEKQYTKVRYSEILDETQEIAEKELDKHPEENYCDMWISIISQIIDIRKKIVDSRLLSDWKEIYERYTIGRIGMDFFDEDDEIYLRLCDIFHGTVHYNELADK